MVFIICFELILTGFSENLPSQTTHRRRSFASSTYHGTSSRLHKASQKLLATSTPNLTAIGLVRSRSTSSFTDRNTLERSKMKKHVIQAKRNIKKQLSKLERKPSKSRLHKFNLPATRRLYDETEISTEPESLSTPSLDELFSQLSIKSQQSFK